MSLHPFHVDEGCVIRVNFRQKTGFVERCIHLFNAVKAQLCLPVVLRHPPQKFYSLLRHYVRLHISSDVSSEVGASEDLLRMGAHFNNGRSLPLTYQACA
jgi:hypothetical protein